MTDAERTPTRDEQVYQENKEAPELHVVYSDQSDDTAGTSGDDRGVTDTDVDEAIKETFPGSDAPTTSASAGVPDPSPEDR